MTYLRLFEVRFCISVQWSISCRVDIVSATTAVDSGSIPRSGQTKECKN